MNLVFQTFVLIGVCFMLKYGSILNPIRERLSRFEFFKKLFKCCMCMGFWVGCFFGLIWGGGLSMVPYWGFYSSSVCWLADYITMVFDKYLEHDNVDK
jgi:uncharacterized membrane protein YfcA